jgi:hypothetical protein
MRDYLSAPNERQAAARCLGLLLDACRQVADSMLQNQPMGGVLAGNIARLEENPAADAVSLHRAVAVDHLAAFSELLAIPASHAPSLASLARSCIETWGRAWWIMTSTSTAQAEYRARAMVVEELMTARKRGVTLLSRESIEDALDRAKSERDSVVDAQSEFVPGYTALAQDLLKQAGVTDDAAAYSHLSGVAHGEAIFTESLSDRPKDGANAPAMIGLPSKNLFVYCTELLGVTAIATHLLIQAWGLPKASGDAFAKAVVDTALGLKTIRGFSTP